MTVAEVNLQLWKESWNFRVQVSSRAKARTFPEYHGENFAMAVECSHFHLREESTQNVNP